MSGDDMWRDLDPIEYLLDEMNDADRASFEARLGEDGELREQVAEAESLVVALRELPEDAWAPPEPPPLAIELNGRVAAGPDPSRGQVAEGAAPAATSEPPRRRADPAPTSGPESRGRFLDRFRVPVLAGAATALLAAGIGLGALIAGGDPATSPSPRVLSSSALRPAGPFGRRSRGEAVIRRGGDGEQDLSVSVSGMPATAPGRYYELWLMRGDRLVSLGGFKVGAAGSRDVDVPLPVDPADYRLIDISLERAGGDPGHSAVSLLRGPV